MKRNNGIEGQLTIFDCFSFDDSEKIDCETIPEIGETVFVANIHIVRTLTVTRVYRDEHGKYRVCGFDDSGTWDFANWFFSRERATRSGIYTK